MTTIVVDTDSDWSALTIGINDTVEIVDGAKLVLDVKAKVYQIIVVDGFLEFTHIDGADFFSPNLTLKDCDGAGITMHKGVLSATSDLGGVMIRSDRRIHSETVYGAEFGWDFKIAPGSVLEDIELRNTEFITAEDLKPSLYFTDNDVLHRLEFEYLSDAGNTNSVDVHKNTLDGGRSFWSDFDRTSELSWGFSTSFRRNYGGKRKLAVLRHILTTSQRFSPVLFVSRELWSWVRLLSISSELHDGFYDIAIDLEEVKGAYEEY